MFFAAYVLARWCAAWPWAGVFIVWCSSSGPAGHAQPWWALAFALLGSAILGMLGLLAGLRRRNSTSSSAFQNFLVLPLTLLSGVFYSIHSLPPFWQSLSHFNPFFYMIDGFRYGFFGIVGLSRRRGALRSSRCRRCLGALTLVTAASGWKLRP